MMLFRIQLMAFGCFFSSLAFSQTFRLSGKLLNSRSGEPAAGATIKARPTSDTTRQLSVVSDSSGRFILRELVPGTWELHITFVAFTPIRRTVTVSDGDTDIGFIQLVPASNTLADVTVTATAPMATQKGDTLQFNASQFKVNPDATAEDLARKMPGITVENGQVKAQGENVQRVTIDGRELFGDDATAALRNLPAEIIDKIQVFDRLSDQAQFTGFDDGSSQKGINIITKANMRNGQYGRVFAGYGTDDRYSAGGNSTILKENRKISLVGNFNNINQQNFAQQDLLGVTSGTQRQGGGRQSGGQRGGRGGNNAQGGNNAGNFLVAQQNGINETIAAGINYADNWGKKWMASGSYFFNQAQNTTSEEVSREYFLKGIPSFSQSTGASSKNINHRVNGRLEYRIDSFNQLTIAPSISFQKNNALRNVSTSFANADNTGPGGSTANATNSKRNGYNFSNNILYRHAFARKGRTISLNVNTSANNRAGDVYTDVFDTTFAGGSYIDSTSRRFTDQQTNGYQVSGNLAYTEPLGKNGQLQFNYNHSYSSSNADQEAKEFEKSTNAYSLFNPNLSSTFRNVYSTKNGGISFRIGSRDNQFSIGTNYQHASLYSDQELPRSLTVDQSFSNILPNAMLRLKLSAKDNIRVFYRAATNQPSVTQLQDVYDITNVPFITAGNPQLEQQYTHTLSTRYTYNNTQKNLLFVGNIFVQSASNYITNASYVALKDSMITSDIELKAGQQLSRPVNLDGYLNLRSFVNFAFPIRLLKTNVNLNGGVTYSRLPGLINNVQNNSKAITYSTGLVLASNISQYVDFNISYSANFNNVQNDVQPQLDNRYYSHAASLQLNLLSKSGWFVQADVTNQYYSGLSSGFNQSYFLWNSAVGKKFLKNQKGEVKLGVFDLLQQNQSIARSVTENYIEDSRNVVLQRYFILTFTYNLRNFGAPAPSRRR